MNNKLRVAVLLGGDSNEKEISLDSGRNVVYKISGERYDAFPIFVSSKRELYRIDHRLLVHNSTKEIEHALTPAMRISWSDLPSIADFAFIGLHGGIGENGCVQGALEMLGLPYNGSSIFASALCMDKNKTNTFLAAHGFDIPRNLLINKNDWLLNQSAVIASITQNISTPFIVKPHDDGCSVMVQKAATESALCDALAVVFAQKQYALVEECIVGMELTIGVVGNNTPHALPPSQALAARGILSIEEKFLPGAGENQTPAPLPSATLAFVQHTIEKAYSVLNCRGYARIDCFYQDDKQSPTGKERAVLLECNTLPGLTPATVLFHQAAELGVSPSDFITMIIELGRAAHTPHNVVTATPILTEQVIVKQLQRSYVARL